MFSETSGCLQLVRLNRSHSLFGIKCQLRCRVPVDVLVEPALPRARVAREAPIGILRATLVDVGTVRVAVAAFTRIRASDHVTPVGPDAVREPPDRAEVSVV